MLIENYVPKIGLLFNTAGAVILTIASASEGDYLVNILSLMKDTYGRYDSNIKEVVPEIDRLIKRKGRNKILNKIAWLMFIIGFIFQLV